MFNGSFAFITVDFDVEDKWVNESWFRDDSGRRYTISEVYDSFLDLSAEKPDLENKHKNFSEEVRRRMADPPFNSPMKKSEKVHIFFVSVGLVPLCISYADLYMVVLCIFMYAPGSSAFTPTPPQVPLPNKHLRMTDTLE